MKIFVSAILLACVAQAMCDNYRQDGIRGLQGGNIGVRRFSGGSFGGSGSSFRSGNLVSGGFGGGNFGGSRVGGSGNVVRRVVTTSNRIVGGGGGFAGANVGGGTNVVRRVATTRVGGGNVGSFGGSSFGGGSFGGSSFGGGSFGGGSFGGGVRRVSTGSVGGGSLRGSGFSFGGSRGGTIDPNNFANIDASAFGFDNFGNTYINVDAFDFNGWRNAAQAAAPREAINAAQTEQIVIGRRFRSGSARQTETSGASREGSGSGEAGIELSASRTASQDATQQFTQQASGEGSTSQGAGYGFERNNNGQVRFIPVKLDSLPVHSGPRNQLPGSAHSNTYRYR